MNMQPWKSSSVSALALGAILALTGCGSGGEESAASVSPSSSAPASTSPSAPASASTAPSAPESSAPGTAAPTASSAAAVPESPAGPGSCAAADLAGSIEDTIGGGAAGSVYRTLVLTNMSEAACTAAPGYPGVSYIDAAGEQIGAAAVRADGSAGGAVVGGAQVLEPGQSAVAELRETRAENYGADCVAHPATQLLVYPPEDLESVSIQHEVVACENPNVELLSVGPLQKR